jgi:hypothetical protein
MQRAHKFARHARKQDQAVAKHHFELGNPLSPTRLATPAAGATTVFNKQGVTGGDFGWGPMGHPDKAFTPGAFHRKVARHKRKAIE